MTGFASVRSLPDRRCHLGQEFALQHPARPGLDLVDLCLVLAETGHILGLATPHAVVDRKLCTIVFDIRISHLFTPFQEARSTPASPLPERISITKVFETSRSLTDLPSGFFRDRRMAAHGHRNLTAVPVTNTTTMPPLPAGMLIS